MTCQTFDLGDGVTFIGCSRDHRRRVCQTCGEPASKLCDYALRASKTGKTCDAPLCERHAIDMGVNDKGERIDHCPVHARFVAGLAAARASSAARAARTPEQIEADRREVERQVEVAKRIEAERWLVQVAEEEAASEARAWVSANMSERWYEPSAAILVAPRAEPPATWGEIGVRRNSDAGEQRVAPAVIEDRKIVDEIYESMKRDNTRDIVDRIQEVMDRNFAGNTRRSPEQLFREARGDQNRYIALMRAEGHLVSIGNEPDEVCEECGEELADEGPYRSDAPMFSTRVWHEECAPTGMIPRVKLQAAPVKPAPQVVDRVNEALRRGRESPRAARDDTPRESIDEKVRHVKSQGQTREHHCHWPGCDAQCPPAAWGCRSHWYALPKYLRDKIWRAYRSGQERTMTPSREYLDVADEVQRWIQDNRKD